MENNFAHNMCEEVAKLFLLTGTLSHASFPETRFRVIPFLSSYEKSFFVVEMLKEHCFPLW